MALVINDRVKESTTTTGTGAVTLAGAVSGFETFLAGIGNSNTTYYAIVLNAEFEVGLGTLAGDSSTLARTTVISSSNSDNAVDFSAGAKEVFCCLPASKSTVLDASNNLTIPGAFTSAGLVTTGGNIVIPNAGTIGSASDTNAIGISSGGVVSITATTASTNSTSGALTVAGGMGVAADLGVGDDIFMLTDNANIFMGADAEVAIEHLPDVGLIIQHTANGDNTPMILQLKSGEAVLTANEVIASLEFSGLDNSGTDASGVHAGIHAIAEGEFTASANPTKLVFTTGVSEAADFDATAKMTLSSAGLLTIADDFMIKDGGTIGVASTNDAITISSAGAVTFKNDITVADDLIVTGDFTVNGDTTTINTTNKVLTDSIIELANGASGTPSNDAGIVIERGSAANAFIGFDESADKFIVGTGTFTGATTGNLSITTGTLVANLDAVTVTTSGVVSVDDTTNTSSGTTGSIHTDGGLGVALNLFVATNATVSGTTLMTGVTTHGGNVVSDTDSTDDLGTTGVRWANLFVDAITATDQITATGFTGTLDGVLGSGSAAAATTTALASTTITASGIIKTDDTTNASTTTDGSLQTDGGLSVVLDAVLGNDIKLRSDSSRVLFGTNLEVSLTHTNDVGLTLNSTNKLMFNDATQFIQGASGTVLNIGATDEVDITSTLIDINGNVEISGTTAQVGVATFTARDIHSGGITVADAGNIGSASDLDAIAIGADGDITLTQDLELQHDGAILSFGANDEIALTHVHDTGLLLTDSGGSPTLQLHNASEAVSSDGSKLILTSNGVAFSLPTADGDDGQVMKTNGSGVFSFTDVSATALAADNISIGDAAVLLSTSSGNIVIDAAANDSDIIFKGTDGNADTTFLTIDGSAAGAATFNNDVTAFSDERLKDNIETIPDALDKVCQMRGVTFNRTDFDGEKQMGVIAQEVEKVIPEVVREDDSEDKIKSVAYGNMVGVLIEAIKELKAEVDELKNRS